MRSYIRNSSFLLLVFIFLGIWTLCLLYTQIGNSRSKFRVSPPDCFPAVSTLSVEVEQTLKSKTTIPPTPQKPKVRSESSGVAESGYWVGLDAAQHHVFDTNLSKALVKIFKEKKAETILELGAGMGKYSETFMKEGFSVSCYDGNPNTQELSGGRCAALDLSKPIHLSRYDWVLSLEVGEHIPIEFEETFLNNLDIGNKHGVILSWAVEGQGGRSHVNCRNNSHVKKAMEMRGYSEDLKNEKLLRNQATFYWFKDTIMVFTR